MTASLLFPVPPLLISGSLALRLHHRAQLGVEYLSDHTAVHSKLPKHRQGAV
ncbi:MAG: hypothetical protein U0787_22940 [Polyangia bacterium]